MAEENLSQKFADGIWSLNLQIKTRTQALRRGLMEEIKRCREENNVADLARCYVHFREAWEDLEEEFKSTKQALTQLAENDFPAMLETSSLSNVPLEDLGRTVGVQVRTMASINGGMKEDAIAYLRADRNAIEALEQGDYDKAYDALMLAGRRPLAEELMLPNGQADTGSIIREIKETTEGLADIVVDHVFSQTLSSIAKEWAEEGKELPEDLFKTYLKTNTTWRKNAASKK